MNPISASAAREVADFLDAHLELACLPADRPKWREVIGHLRGLTVPKAIPLKNAR